MSEVRVPLVVNEPVTEGDPNARVNFVVNEPVSEGVPNARTDFVVNEPVHGGFPNVRASAVILESVHPITPEAYVSTDVFPELPGLAFDVQKTPNFNTMIAKSVNRREVRNALMQFPVWQFKLTYDFLPDRPVTVGETALRTLCGFFLKRQGSYDTFLFLDPDDHSTVGTEIGIGDGTTTQFYWARDFGGFVEPIGQIDTTEAYEVRIDGVPQVEGVDYTITLPNLIVFSSAPLAAEVITADLSYYFVCRFSEDAQEYSKFMDKLWELQTCEFESVIS